MTDRADTEAMGTDRVTGREDTEAMGTDRVTGRADTEATGTDRVTGRTMATPGRRGVTSLTPSRAGTSGTTPPWRATRIIRQAQGATRTMGMKGAGGPSTKRAMGVTVLVPARAMAAKGRISPFKTPL